MSNHTPIKSRPLFLSFLEIYFPVKNPNPHRCPLKILLVKEFFHLTGYKKYKDNGTILTLSCGGRYHIETSPLIYEANQWTGFYMITASVMKELIHDVLLIHLSKVYTLQWLVTVRRKTVAI